jgi:hypothetical protein
MKTQKICKGQNRAHGYEGCGKVTDVKRLKYGLCASCLIDWGTTTEGGKLWYSTTFLPKVKASVNKERKKKDLETMESLKSIARLIQEARVPFQKWIRLRDANDGCISCDSVNVKIWHAGHYFKAELFTGLIFDEINVNKQCEKCNTFLGGNETGYRKGLIAKYGEKAVKDLELRSNELREYKFTREELKAIKTKYQKLLKND